MAIVVALVIAAGVTVEVASSLGTHSPERSGPVSTFPASWVSVCGINQSGMATTGLSLGGNGSIVADHINLKVIYNQIINSLAFNNVSQGSGWVVAYWIYSENTYSGGLGTNASYTYQLTSELILVNDTGNPSGYVHVYYNLQTETFGVGYSDSQAANCPLDNP
jgi:hypothetical protein